MAHPLFDFSHLSAAERAQLAVDLWDSIALEQADDLPIPMAHRTEIARRHAAYLKDPDSGASWEEVKEDLLAGLKRPSTKGRQAKRRRR